VDELRALGSPLQAHIEWMTCDELLSLYEAHMVNRRHYAVETRWLADLTVESIAALAEAGEQRSSPYSMIAVHHFHGAGTRMPLATTAFGLRDQHFRVEFFSSAPPLPV
jgi:hypothetical protein